MITFLFTRPGRWLAGAAVLLAIGAVIYWYGGQSARQEARDLRDHISTTERMNEADPDFSAGCGWFDRLHARCE